VTNSYHELSTARKGKALTPHETLFGTGISTATGSAAESLRVAVQADRDGLDLFTVSDHPYYGGRLDAYAQVGVALGRTERISGLVSVTNLPSRPAPPWRVQGIAAHIPPCPSREPQATKPQDVDML
jgi:hypothetical protein